jgi:hypothetical protein
MIQDIYENTLLNTEVYQKGWCYQFRKREHEESFDLKFYTDRVKYVIGVCYFTSAFALVLILMQSLDMYYFQPNKKQISEHFAQLVQETSSQSSADSMAVISQTLSLVRVDHVLSPIILSMSIAWLFISIGGVVYLSRASRQAKIRIEEGIEPRKSPPALFKKKELAFKP